MEISIVLSAKPKIGNLSRVLLASHRLGLKIAGNRVNKVADGIEKIVLTVNSAQPIFEDDLAPILKRVPTIFGVEIIQPRQLTPNDLDQIQNMSQQLADWYPDISDVVPQLFANLHASDQSHLLNKIGINVGMRAYEHYSASSEKGVLGQAVSDSLAMQQAAFQSMPVIADLFATNQRQPKKKSNALLEQIQAGLSNFCSVSIEGKGFVVQDCPECRQSHEGDEDCEFVMGFISGFGRNLVPKLKVVQADSMSKSSAACRFQIGVSK